MSQLYREDVYLMAMLLNDNLNYNLRSASKSAASMTSEDSSGRLRVLIVEDDYLVAMTIEQAIRLAGMDAVGIAPTRDRALRMGEELAPDFATMDINLRGDQAGTDIAREFHDRLGIRSLFISAHAHDPKKLRAAEPAHPLDWVDKPFTTDYLVTRLRRAGESVRQL